MEATPPRLLLFGPPAVVLGEQAVPLPLERRTQMLVWLALRREPVARAELAALLWPGQSRKQAFGNLRTTLFRAQSLPWAAALQADAAALRITLPSDVAEFEAALRGSHPGDMLALYRGELLAGFDDGSSEPWTRWLAFERERLRGARRSAALARLAADTEPAAALALAHRLLDEDPLDEAALQAQMAWLQRSGQPAAARTTYRAYAQRLQQELGVEPGEALRRLHAALGPDAPATAPARAEAGFVGRVVEQQRITTLLARDDCRLLCLIGPGGVGKTRLSRRLLQALAAGFADGGQFVALEDVDSPGAFAHRVLQQLGVLAHVARGDALQAVIAALQPRQMLLVLDNFEQLAAEGALLEQLLQACPRLKLLVTSRVRLAVAGSWSLPLEGLPCPEPEDEAEAERFDAVHLFLQTAQRVQPALSLAAERKAIVDICRQVDGLPLAIELAAAWTRLMPCSAIAAALRQGTGLLHSTDATHSPRHASLEQVFEQSWSHLAAAEREALARLSVFRGGFTAEAARAVAGASLPVLAALADKSMLQRQGSRLQLHPLVQQLAHQRLDDEALRARTLDAHADHFLALLSQLRRDAENGHRGALDTIDAECDNVQAALRQGVALGRAGALAQALPAVMAYCENRARFEDGGQLLRAVMQAPALQGDTVLQATACGMAAMLLYRQARFADAEALGQQAMTQARRCRDPAARIVALRVLAACALNGGRLEASQALWRDALALARRNAMSTGPLLDNLGVVAKHRGDYEDSLRLSAEALVQYRARGQQAALAQGLSNRASLCLFLDDTDQALAHLREAAALAESEGLTSTRAYVLGNLAELALKSQDWAAAQLHAERALALARPAALRSLAGWLLVQLARLAARRGESATAARTLAEAAAEALILDTPSLKGAVVLGLAELVEGQGHAAPARRLLALAADDPGLGAANRDELRAEWARRAAALSMPDRPGPAFTLHELLRGVVSGAEQGFAALVEQMGGR